MAVDGRTVSVLGSIRESVKADSVDLTTQVFQTPWNLDLLEERQLTKPVLLLFFCLDGRASSHFSVSSHAL